MMMMSNKMMYNNVGDDETSQSMRTGLIVVQSSHAPGLKAIFENMTEELMMMMTNFVMTMTLFSCTANFVV